MKEIHVKYYGQLAEIRGVDNEIILTDKVFIQDLLNELYHRWPQIQTELFAVFINNKKNSNSAYMLTQLDEVSLLPPFAGG